MLGPASSRLQIPEPIPDNPEQGQESAYDSIYSHDGEYEGNDGQSQESQESQEENELEQDGDDEDLLADWGAQRPIGNEFRNSQPSILTITPGNTQSSSRMIAYPVRRTPAPVHVSQNRFASAVLSRSPAVLNQLATPAITSSHSDQIPELDSRGGERTSSRRNMAVGLERSILAKACSLMWDWAMFVNPFPDPITLTEEVRRCWNDARNELAFPNFADATLVSNDQVSYR